MAKFKVGDKVRRIGHKFEGWNVGEIRTITEIPYDGGIQTGDGYTYAASLAELVTEVLSELEQLVATANAGNKAMSELYRNHYDEVEVLYNGTVSTDSPGKWSNSCMKIRIKPKPPTFEPFSVGQGWCVELEDNNRVRVGCQPFNVSTLRDSLQALTSGNHNSSEVRNSSGERAQLHVLRTGISTPWGTLIWEDADRILEALKKLEAK